MIKRYIPKRKFAIKIEVHEEYSYTSKYIFSRLFFLIIIRIL